MTTKQPWASSWLWSPTGAVLLAFLAIAACFLVTEHKAHALGVLPFLLLLLCPLLHLLHGRRGRGGHSGHHEGQRKGAEGGKR